VNLKILQIGKTREKWIKEGIEIYLKRLEPYMKIIIEEIPSVSILNADSQEMVKAKEAAKCLKRVNPEDYIILLDEQGEEKTSLEFTNFLANLSGRKKIVFILGGAYGTHQSIKERADYCLRLSAMTFIHEMTRLILLEQLYRAKMITHNRTYHY
jgi:23S rRNA (pseudouridine1915-N3)-methyltransferase